MNQLLTRIIYMRNWGTSPCDESLIKQKQGCVLQWQLISSIFHTQQFHWIFVCVALSCDGRLYMLWCIVYIMKCNVTHTQCVCYVSMLRQCPACDDSLVEAQPCPVCCQAPLPRVPTVCCEAPVAINYPYLTIANDAATLPNSTSQCWTMVSSHMLLWSNINLDFCWKPNVLRKKCNAPLQSRT